MVDFSLLQRAALDAVRETEGAGKVFRHVIIDEYQDTNAIQEEIVFSLADGHRNLCVVGDDDQALYRFRGATVENFVQFPQRCRARWRLKPKIVPLEVNYRSREDIVRRYSDFMAACDWDGEGGPYRVAGKQIRAHREDERPAVVASRAAAPEEVCAEVASLVRRLVDEGRVADPNQVAFLFPSLQYRGEMTAAVRRMREALEAVGLRVFSPRASAFLEVEEALEMLGVLQQVLGRPEDAGYGGDYERFQGWLGRAWERGRRLVAGDTSLGRFVAERRAEIERVLADQAALLEVVRGEGWDLEQAYAPATMRPRLAQAGRLSERARRALEGWALREAVRRRAAEGRPLPLRYVVRRLTALDWNILDLFYQLTGFARFRGMFDLAEIGEDEGPIVNLGLLSRYLARYVDEYATVVTAELLEDGRLQNTFYWSFLYTLFRRGEREFEDEEDPFPRGRIPFLTVHQAKGLEFPVVVVGNLRKDHGEAPVMERLLRPYMRRAGEPPQRMAEFDAMRLFYVALSRAKNLVILPHYAGRGQRMNAPFARVLEGEFPRIEALDPAEVPEAKPEREDIPRSYSYTADFLLYEKCPRQYMVFRKYGFVPSRTRTMMFGSLVHRTLDDLHNYLIRRRAAPAEDDPAAIERLIEVWLVANYEHLRLEGGPPLAPSLREQAGAQARMYWRKLRDVATRVTETEVKLSLSGQRSPQGRLFGLEGVVDIVREGERTAMYDIKTHDVELIAAAPEQYARQLNLYAFIWQELRGQRLDEAAIISTVVPEEVRLAEASGEPEALERALECWEPVVPVPFSKDRVAETLAELSRTVDRIEEGSFSPPEVSRLRAPAAVGGKTFAREVCQYCDARFSCTSYRLYAAGSVATGDRLFSGSTGEPVGELVQDEWAVAGLDASPAGPRGME
jgi:DNA helicase-2/ATP-dependent DNA helicase PcrA